jgi:hypothetical protein
MDIKTNLENQTITLYAVIGWCSSCDQIIARKNKSDIAFGKRLTNSTHSMRENHFFLQKRSSINSALEALKVSKCPVRNIYICVLSWTSLFHLGYFM